MFRRISSLPAVLVLALAISSCERVDIEVGQTGYLCVDLQQDLTVDPVFKSDAAGDMTFSITVRDHKDEVIKALSSGASGVSTGRAELWE